MSPSIASATVDGLARSGKAKRPVARALHCDLTMERALRVRVLDVGVQQVRDARAASLA